MDDRRGCAGNRSWVSSRCRIHHTCTDGKTIPGHIVQFSPDQNSITGTVLIGGESSIVNKMVLLNTITLRGCDRGDSGIWHMEERIFHTLAQAEVGFYEKGHCRVLVTTLGMARRKERSTGRYTARRGRRLGEQTASARTELCFLHLTRPGMRLTRGVSRLRLRLSGTRRGSPLRPVETGA